MEARGSVADLVEARRRRLLREIAGNGVPLAVAPDLPALVAVIGGTIEPSPPQRRSSALVLRRAGAPATLWVRRSLGGYRAAFLAFAEREHGVPADDPAWGRHEIDHMVSRGQVDAAGDPWMRLEALPRDVNGDWGRLVERLAAAGVWRKKETPWRRVNDLVVGKYLGARAPKGSTDLAAVDAVVGAMRALGMDAWLAARMREGILDQLDRMERTRRPTAGATEDATS